MNQNQSKGDKVDGDTSQQPPANGSKKGAAASARHTTKSIVAAQKMKLNPEEQQLSARSSQLSKGGTLLPRKRAAALLPHYQKNSEAVKPSKAPKQAAAPSKAATAQHPSKEAAAKDCSLTTSPGAIVTRMAPTSTRQTRRGGKRTAAAQNDEETESIEMTQSQQQVSQLTKTAGGKPNQRKRSAPVRKTAAPPDTKQLATQNKKAPSKQADSVKPTTRAVSANQSKKQVTASSTLPFKPAQQTNKKSQLQPPPAPVKATRSSSRVRTATYTAAK